MGCPRSSVYSAVRSVRPFAAATASTAPLTSLPIRASPLKLWATTTVPAVAVPSEPFCAIRCWAKTVPPSITNPTMATTATRASATMTMTWPCGRSRCLRTFSPFPRSRLTGAGSRRRVRRHRRIRAYQFDRELSPGRELDRPQDVADDGRDRLPVGSSRHDGNATDRDRCALRVGRRIGLVGVLQVEGHEVVQVSGIADGAGERHGLDAIRHE